MKYSYKAERNFYSKRWPEKAPDYAHLESYLRCWIEDTVKVFKGRSVLDLGAGECEYTRLICELCNPRLMVALDLFSERMLPASCANSNPTLSIVAGDCFKLPFRDNSFDVICGIGILHHVWPLEGIISEISRVLRPGGIYLGWEPNPYSPVCVAIHYGMYRLLGQRTANEYLLWCHKFVPAFESHRFKLKITYFWGRFPSIRNKFLSSSMSITACKNTQ